MKLRYVISENDSNKTLKEVLKKKLYISNILLNKLKYTNSIFVNGNLEFVNYKVNINDEIIVDFEHMNYVIYTDKENMYYVENKYLDRYKKYDFDIDILYEDDYLLIINKKAGMAIHPSCANYEKTLSNAVATYLESKKIYSVHIVTRLEILREFNPDIIHVHTEFSMGLFGIWAAKKLKKTLVYTLHTAYDDYVYYVMPKVLARMVGGKVLDKFLGLYAGKSKAIVGPSPKCFEYIKKTSHRKKVRILPNSVEMTLFDFF